MMNKEKVSEDDITTLERKVIIHLTKQCINLTTHEGNKPLQAVTFDYNH